MAAAFEHAHEARTALRAIVSDPAHGHDALLSSQTIASLLSDFLPDAPRESGLLIAAVSKDVPANLRQHAADGLDASTAIRLAASSFAASTAYSADACLWATGELALAMGLAGPGDLVADVAVPEAGTWPPAAGPAEHTTVGAAGPGEHTTVGAVGAAGFAADPGPVPAKPGEHRGARSGRRPRMSTFAVVGVVIVLVAGAAAAGAALVISNLSGGSSSRPPAATGAGHATSPAAPASSPASNPASTQASPVASVASPAAVVRAYLAAVNRRDWPEVWRLGGKNLGQSYRQMVAGYRLTSRVVITSLTASGDAVYVRVLAYETTGAVQTYALSYVVTDGIIVTGQSTLLSG